MCRNWEMTGKCKWQDKCSFAHGRHELTKKTHMPKNFKSKTCEQFHDHAIGSCTFGNRCQFLHSNYDIYNENVAYSTMLAENSKISKDRNEQVENAGDELIYLNVFKKAQGSRLQVFKDISNKNYQYTTQQ